MDLESNILDDGWINKFDTTDKLYNDFYKDDLYYVNLRVIYINRDNEIDKLKQDSFLMSTPNRISREEIVGILKHHSIDNHKRYSLLSILKYNIDLEPNDIHFYLNNARGEEYLSVIKNIDAIVFNKTINMFHDLNDLIIIFYEKSHIIKKSDVASSTKKIYIRSLSSNKKTIKYRYKD